MASRPKRPPSYLVTVLSSPSTAKWLQGIRSVRSYMRLVERLRSGADVNACEANGVRALHIAARYGAVEQLKHLLEDGADATLKTAFGWTALEFAHTFLQTEVVNYLTVHRAIVEKLTEGLQRPPTVEELYIAMNFDEFRRFRANMKEQVETQGERFVKAARRDDLELVRAMLETNQVHVDDVSPVTGETAYSAALSSGRQEMCEYLLASGAHPCAACIVDGEPRAPLAVAVQSGDVSFVKRLVLAGASRQTRPHDSKMCALLQAINMGSIPMIDALFELNVRLYSTALGARLSIPAIVAPKASSIKSSDVKSWLALCCACWFQDVRLVQHLLDTRTVFQDAAELSTNGVHALLLAVYRENFAVTTLLLERGISPNQQRGRDGMSAVGVTASIDSVSMLRFLVDRGAAVKSLQNPQLPREEVSLLLFAVQHAAVNCARELLPVETQQDNRDLALAEAVRYHDQAFVAFMLDHSPPSTVKVLISCVEKTSGPEMLDLLLTHEKVRNHLLLKLDPGFQWSWERSLSADKVSVMLAHGLTVTCPARGTSGWGERSYGTVVDIFTEETNVEF